MNGRTMGVCRGQEKLMTFWRQNVPAGMSMTINEVASPAHRPSCRQMRSIRLSLFTSQPASRRSALIFRSP
jgi:hypothetical protein